MFSENLTKKATLVHPLNRFTTPLLEIGYMRIANMFITCSRNVQIYWFSLFICVRRYVCFILIDNYVKHSRSSPYCMVPRLLTLMKILLTTYSRETWWWQNTLIFGILGFQLAPVKETPIWILDFQRALPSLPLSDVDCHKVPRVFLGLKHLESTHTGWRLLRNILPRKLQHTPTAHPRQYPVRQLWNESRLLACSKGLLQLP